MASIRAIVTLLLVALTLGLALPVAAQPLSGPEYIPLMPCRVFDSRGGPRLPEREPTNITIGGVCGVPPTAIAAELNFAIVDPQGGGNLTVFPKDGTAPLASLVNFVAGQTVANAAAVKLGAGGAISAEPTTTTHLVIDVYGYFTDVEELANFNTALGAGAMANVNLSFPGGALNNTAVGFDALRGLTTGSRNIAVGFDALRGGGFPVLATPPGPITGSDNTAIGAAALQLMTNRNGNVAVGSSALFFLMGGDNNTAIGTRAGQSLRGGSNNIYIGSGVASPTTLEESNTIRIGGNQTITFVAGVATTAVVGSPVCVTTTGQLGRCPSLPSASSNQAAGTRRRASVRDIADAELVMVEDLDESASVGYQTLLNEVQRQRRELDELRAQVRVLIGGRAAVRE
jgi:hypothetical protein